MLTPLFMDGDASDPSYVNIRDAKDGPLRSARYHCEYLWSLFEPHADSDFRTELRREFDARYWEMYLTTSLIVAGYSVTCPKPAGPDVGILFKGRRIWFEATCPTSGRPGAPDAIGESVMGQVPEEKIILRYLNSISTKYKEQCATWLEKGIVSDEDAFVIAINPRAIPFDHGDSDPPRILQAGYTVGPAYGIVDLKTMQAVGVGYQFRNKIMKASKAEGKMKSEVTTGVFQSKEYARLSGLLCSRVDAANRPGEMGDDFQLAPNPHASVPLPEGFRLRGVYYNVIAVKDGYDMTPTRTSVLPFG
jgi:hypothetical protein